MGAAGGGGRGRGRKEEGTHTRMAYQDLQKRRKRKRRRESRFCFSRLFATPGELLIAHNTQQQKTVSHALNCDYSEAQIKQFSFHFPPTFRKDDRAILTFQIRSNFRAALSKQLSSPRDKNNRAFLSFLSLYLGKSERAHFLGQTLRPKRPQKEFQDKKLFIIPSPFQKETLPAYR